MPDLNINQGSDPSMSWIDTKTAIKETDQQAKTADIAGVREQSTIEQTSTVKQQQFIDPGNPKLMASDAPFEPEALNLFNFKNPDQIKNFFNQLVTARQASDKQYAKEDQETFGSIVVKDPEVVNLAQKIGQLPGKVQKDLETNYSSLLKMNLKDQVSPEDLEKLFFAHFFPEDAANLSPNLKAILKKAEDQTNEQIRKDQGMPEDWEPPQGDMQEFTEELSGQYDQEFDSALLQYSKDNGLSKESAAQLRAMHYGMEDVPDAANLKEAFQNIEKQVSEKLSQQFGTAINWKPEPNSTTFSQMLVGAFQSEFDKNINKVKPPLSESDIALIRAFLKDPSTPIPENLKAIAQQLKATSLSSIRGSYGLPETWMPNAELAFNPPLKEASLNVAQNGIDEAREVLDQAKKLVDAMPPGTEKMVYANFLLILGSALNKLQEMLYLINGSDAKLSKALNFMQLDTEMNRLEKERKQIEEIRNKKNKMANMGPLSKIMDWIMKIMVVVVAALLAMVTGGLSLVLAAAYIIDSVQAEARGEKTGMQMLFDEVNKGVGEEAGLFINLLISAIMSGGNPMLLVSYVCTDARIIQNGVKMLGGNKMAQEITAMVLQIVLQILMMVVMLICTAGISLPGAIAPAIASATHISVNVVIWIMRIISIVFQLIMSSIQIATQAVTINNKIIEAQIVILQAEQEAFAEETIALINALKKMIKYLLDALQGNTDWILDISKFQGEKYSKLSEITTDLAS